MMFIGIWTNFMGTLLKAKCGCGFKNERIYFGAGMEDEGICNVPALRNGSSTIEMKNIRKKEGYLDYIFYTEKICIESDGIDKFYNAWEFKLRKRNNLCPKCKNYEMDFIYIGEYD